MKAFIIDDNHVSVFLTENMLRSEGFAGEIFTFLTAEKALDVIIRNLNKDLPNFILLDLNMPVMNGWEFLDALEPYKQQLLGKCQIFILTSSLDLSDLARSENYELICGFNHKPLDEVNIKAILDAVEFKLNKD